jgi:pimeloyl-ACP methyl ester carboxylesterase
LVEAGERSSIPIRVEQYHEINGLRTFSRSMGKGRDVVLVHGVGVSSEYWRPAQEALVGMGPYRVHAVDLPGFGRSADPSSPMALPALATHLAKWIHTALPGPCDLIGQSLGCEISVLCSLQSPQRVRSLVLAGPAGLPTLRSVFIQLLRGAIDAPREKLSLFGAIVPDYLRAGGIKVFRLLREQKLHPFSSLLTGVGQPTLIIRGASDPIATAERTARVAALLRDATVVTIPGAHAAHYSRADLFAMAVSAFLEEQAALKARAGTPALRDDTAAGIPARRRPG